MVGWAVGLVRKGFRGRDDTIREGVEGGVRRLGKLLLFVEFLRLVGLVSWLRLASLI